MIPDGFHRKHLKQIFDSAGVILVIMRDKQDVDALGVGQFGRVGDAVGVAAAIARVASVDQHGLTGGRDHQRCLASFGIDEENFKILRCLGGDGEEEYEEECPHLRPS